MLGKERDGLCAIFNLLLNRVNRSSLLDEICLAKLIVLVVAKIFDGCDDLHELVVVKLILLILPLDFFVVVIHVHLVNLLLFTVHSVHHAIHEVVPSSSLCT